jgi:uncharacterized membrane protein HdeD (DUF308 family)
MASFPSQDLDFLNGRNAVLADNWWAVALRGVIAILFGIAAFGVPGATMLALVLLFGAYSLVDGIFSIVLAVRGARRQERWGLLLLNGLFGIALGIAAAVWPGITLLAFILILAAWAVVSGILMLGAAIGLKISHGRWWLVLAGAVSLAYGVLLFMSPLVGALVLTWWVGAYALVFGVILLILAYRLRRHRGQRLHGGAMPAPT